MPSEKILAKKQEEVAALAELLKGSCAGVLVDYKGINVAKDTALRRELREANVTYKVVKNSLLKRAAIEAGLDGLDSALAGTTAIAVSAEDPVAPAKIITKYSDEIKKGFDIKSGFMDGTVMEVEKVVALGKLPSKEQLVGQLVSVLVAPIRGLAVALNAIAEKNGEE